MIAAPQSENVEYGRQPMTITLRVPSWLVDNVLGFLRLGWEFIKETATCLSFLMVPIMDEMSLVSFSISLLLLEKLCGSCLSMEPTLVQIQMQQATRREIVHRSVVADSSQFLIPPLFGLLGTLALVMACVANSSSNALLLTPHWFRLLTSQHTVYVIYTLLGLFCLESILVLSILLLAGHALIFPDAATSIQNLFLLFGVWLGSLTGSHFLRRHLYRSLGS